MDVNQAFAQIEDLPWSRKILILVVIALLICGGYWYFYYQPATQRITRINERIDSLERDIKVKREQIEKLPQLREKMQKQKRVLAHARDLLPKDKPAVENILAQIEQLGREESVEFLSFNPGGESSHKLYVTRSVSLKLQGPFHNLMHFFSRISSLDTLITIESIKLNPQNTDQAEEITVTSSNRLLIYRAKDTEN